MSTLRIETPRVFVPLLKPARYKGAHGGRGSGKSHFFAELLIETCISTPTRAVCIREVQKSIKQSVKRLLEDKIQAMGLGHLFKVFDDRIVAPQGGVIIFQGMQDHTAESIKSLEGFDIAWVEEAQALSARSLKLLRPTIRKPGSELWFSWNPENETDPVDKLLRGPAKPADAIVVQANWRDNPYFPDVLRQEMAIDRAKSEDEYLHVWEGHYAIVLEGAVYAEEMRKAYAEERITNVPYDSTKTVWCFWDLGFADHTSIWFVQTVGKEIRVIDFYQNQFKKTPHYTSVLQEKGYVYETIVLPHDAANQTINAERTTERIVREAFPNATVNVLPNPGPSGKKQGIEAARNVFGSCWFDRTRCAEGLEALKNYRYKRNETTGQWGRDTVHDEASHAADAFRYMATSITQDIEEERETFTPQSWMG